MTTGISLLNVTEPLFLFARRGRFQHTKHVGLRRLAELNRFARLVVRVFAERSKSEVSALPPRFAPRVACRATRFRRFAQARLSAVSLRVGPAPNPSVNPTAQQRRFAPLLGSLRFAPAAGYLQR